MEEKVTIVVFSGTVDRLVGMSILTNAAIAMEYEVDIFLMLWGTYAFKKDIIGVDETLSEHLDFTGEEFKEVLKTGGISPWYEILEKAKEAGKVRVHVCSAAGKAWKTLVEDLNFVDDFCGAGEIILSSTESKATYFI
ncbi:MAG: DsrE/DsrF/DrsH-like family protein [Promethearchaeota archaeon]